jgi:DmsE family decaheme c-type cytochrome
MVGGRVLADNGEYAMHIWVYIVLSGGFLQRAALAAATSLILASPLAHAEVYAGKASEPDSDAKCASCHWKEAEAMKATKHGVGGDPRTPAGRGSSCQSCHGPSLEHAENFRVKPAIVFGRTTPASERSAPCLSCHQGDKVLHWAGAAHARNDVGCNDCHKSHAPADAVMVASTQAGVCFDCHKNVRAATLRFSTHPIRTGWMPCSSCHNAHGSVGEASLIKATVNETCYTCHAGTRGPFLWRHPPAQEDCGNCHNPHGSNNAPLLVARMPYLCMQCHLSPMHGSNLFSGSNLPPSTGGAQMLGDSCANCHMKVHGSNHPSGARLTR